MSELSVGPMKALIKVLMIALVIVLPVLMVYLRVPRKHWLMIAFGSGLCVLLLKVLLIVPFDSAPDKKTVTFLQNLYNPVDTPAETRWSEQLTASVHQIPPGHQWQALPGRAPEPDNNRLTADKIALGKKLFFDKQLSRDGTVACVSCHLLTDEFYGADGAAVSTGIEQLQGDRNAPTVLNAAFQRVLFWDGRAASLEEQAKGPFVNPVEMGMPSLQAVEQRVKQNPQYAPLFARAFPDKPAISIDSIAKAIASFERILITSNAPYDRFVQGDRTALTAQQLRGMALFEATGCTLCHGGPNFSTASIFHESSVWRVFPVQPHTEYEAKYKLTRDKGVANQVNDQFQGIWRVPSLRNVSKTAPYFHNGAVESLEEAVRIMAKTQLNKSTSRNALVNTRVNWSGEQKKFYVDNSVALSHADIDAIVAFLESLTGELPDNLSE